MPSPSDKRSCVRGIGVVSQFEKPTAEGLWVSLFVFTAEVSLSKRPESCKGTYSLEEDDKKRYKMLNIIYFSVLHNYCTNTCKVLWLPVCLTASHTAAVPLSLCKGTCCPKALSVNSWWNNHSILSSAKDLMNKNKHLYRLKLITITQLMGGKNEIKYKNK